MINHGDGSLAHFEPGDDPLISCFPLERTHLGFPLRALRASGTRLARTEPAGETAVSEAD